MDNLQEQLTGTGVEDKDGTVDWLGRQVTFKGLVNGNTIDVGIIDEELSLVAEEFRVVLRVEELLVALRSVKLQTLADTLAEDVERRVGLHDLTHSLLDQELQAWEILTVGRVQVVSKVDTDHETSR